MLKYFNVPPVYLLIFFFVLIFRLFVSTSFGLGVDEAHYALYALHLDLSYFDHPPLIAWIQYLSTLVFGMNSFALRLPAIIIGFIVSVLLYNLLYKITENEKSSFIGVLALYASFMFNALFIMLMPITLLFLFTFLVVFSVMKLEKDPSLKNYLLLGMYLGLSGLSNYTAILFIPTILMYFLIKKEFHIIFNFKVLASILLAILIISPVLWWNYKHDWISFNFQINHINKQNGMSFEYFLKSIAAQFGAYNPFLFIVSFFGVYKALGSKNNYLFLSGLLSIVMLSFFTYNSFYAQALPHWNAVFYMLMIPVGSVYLLDLGVSYQNYIRFSIGFGLIISIILYLELVFKFIPQPQYQSMHRDLYGYEKIMQQANAYITDSSSEVLATSHWSLASRMMYYNKDYASEVFLLDKTINQYDIYTNEIPINKDVLFINTRFFKFKKEDYKCASISTLAPMDLLLNNEKVNTVEYNWCYNYQGLRK